MEGIENKNKSSKAKIIVPLIIILIVAGIWFAKSSNWLSGGSLIQGEIDEFIPENADFELYAGKNFDFEKLESYGLPMIIDFGSPTCPPCIGMAQDLRQVHKNMQGKAIVKYIDVQEFPELASDYPVKVVPTQFFFDNEGKPYMPKDPDSMGMLIYTLKDSGEHVLTAHEGALTEEEMTEILKDMGAGNDR